MGRDGDATEDCTFGNGRRQAVWGKAGDNDEKGTGFSQGCMDMMNANPPIMTQALRLLLW